MAITDKSKEDITEAVEAEDHDENDECDEGAPDVVGNGGMYKYTDILP